jgi:superkiller protein 3
MAICLYNLNRKKESIQFYEKILNECPTDIEAQLGICKAFREIGESKRAFEYLEKAFLIFKNDSPKIANLYYEKGMCLYNMNKYEEAINSFEKAIEFSHVNKKLLLSDCYYHKGICLLKLNRKESAIKDFDQAIKYNNKNEDIFNDKAYCLIALEKYQDVINSYLKAIELNKELYAIKSDGYFNIAYCYIKLKNYKEAKKYLTLSQKVNEDKIKEYFSKGLISCDSGGLAPQNYLLDFSKKYKDLCTKFKDINYYLGICNKDLNRCVEALDNFNMCIKYDDKFGEAYYYKGIIFSDLKKHKRAIKQFKKAVECNNKNQAYQKALKKEENKLKSRLDKIKIASINLDDDIKSNEHNKKIKIPIQRYSNTLIKTNNSLNVGFRTTERHITNNGLKLYIKGNNVYKRQNILNKSDSKIKKNTNFNSLNSLNKANLLNTSVIQNNKKEIIDNYNKTEKINKRFKNQVSFKYSGNNIIKSTDYDLRNISPYKKYKNDKI